MEEGLLVKDKISEVVVVVKAERGAKWEITEIVEEVKRLCYIAGPMVAVNLSQSLLQVISLTMVGHLGELSLSSTALAISICSVTAFSLLAGMASALETLCGQAYGAQQYQKLGTQTLTSIFCLLIVCIPLSILWIFLGKILIFLGQDPLISQEAGKFSRYFLPALFGYATIQPIFKYFQSQSLIFPMLISSCTTIIFHILFSWIMVFKSGLNHVGAALAIGASTWLNVTILCLYMKFSPSCAKTRASFSMDIFHGIKEFFHFAVPSAVMICLEWWSYELLVLLSGLVPNPQLETSVLSVCLNTMITLYAIPNALSAAVSTRVSNELGAGNPRGAKLSVLALIFLAAIEVIILDTALFASRHVFGYIFSSDKEVVDYVKDMAPLLCISLFIDGIKGTLPGVARGCGWQHKGACVNLAAFYLFGIPIAVILCFYFNLRGKGLWIGILFGGTMQSILYSIITTCTNWEKQAIKARERLFEEKPSHKVLE